AYLLEVRGAHHLTHGNEDLALADERPPRMLHEHVVESDEVCLFPRKLDTQLLEDFRDTLHRLVRDDAAVAEVDVPGHVLLGEQHPQRIARLRIEAGHVMQLNLVEPDLLSRPGMTRDAGSTLRDAQRVAVLPLALHPFLGAHALDLSTVLGLE